MKEYGGYNPEFTPVSNPLRTKRNDMARRALLQSVEAGPDWRDRAKCLDTDPEVFFIKMGHEAKKICSDCPVTAQCLAFAARAGLAYGVFGGKNRTERGFGRLPGSSEGDEEPMVA